MTSSGIRTSLFLEEQRHFLEGPVFRLAFAPFVALAAGISLGAGHVPNWEILVLLTAAMFYAADRFFVATGLRRDVHRELSVEQIRRWRRRLALHLALQGLLWAFVASQIIPRVPVSTMMLFLCVMITVLGVVCSMLPSPVTGLRLMCLSAYVGGISSAALSAPDLRHGLLLCGVLGLLSTEIFLQRNLKSIRGRLRSVARRELMRRRLVENGERLAALSLSKSLLLATASHDLRQPVHALALLTEKLGLDKDPVVAKERIGTIQATSEYLLVLLNKLMDYSRIDLGKQPVSMTDVEISGLVSQAVLSMREVAHGKGLLLTCQTPGRWMVKSDPALLRRVLHNLLDNALKFTNQGEVACKVAEIGGQILISITDTGPGMPKDVLETPDGPHIRTSKETGGGLGLGLGVVRGLCRLMGCDLSITSADGSGTSVTLAMPCRAGMQVVEVASIEVDATHVDDELHVLLVDDHPVILRAMESLLKEMRFKVSAYETGDEAVAASSDAKFDLVISDLHLGPGFNGLDVIQRVRQQAQHEDVPAILLSGDISFSVPDVPGSTNIRILHKPTSPKNVRRAIGAVLGKASKAAPHELPAISAQSN